MAPYYLNDPDGKHYEVYLVSLQCSKERKAKAIKNDGTTYGLCQVICESHLSHRPHESKKPLKNPGFVQQHDQSKNSKCSECSAGFVKT